MKKNKFTRQSGSSLIVIITLSGIFILGIGALISLLVMEQKTTRHTVASETAFQIAEAGLNQYRWILAHDPTDYAGSDKNYKNAAGDIIGHYTVTVTPPSAGSSIIVLTATGWTTDLPNARRTVRARYGKPSYAEFAFLTNSNVWFGTGEEVHGRLHSNGGIRMDGIGDSLVTTIKNDYTCGSEHGCDDENKPGIWGTGEDPALWEFPVADGVDFNVVTLDLEDMQTAADTADGVLLHKSTDYGYHIIFSHDANDHGYFSVNTVTALKSDVKGYNGTDYVTESNDIKTEIALDGYQNQLLPANGIIFVEDQTWVSGEVQGRITLAAAHLPEDGTASYDIIINDDIEYYPNRTSGSVLGLIAQQDILVPLYSNNNLIIDAALMAKNGHVFRYYYSSSKYSDSIKDYIETYGTIITNTVWTWTWVNSSNQVISGYRQTETNYDPNLIYAPPPFFPTKDEYTFISWEEVTNN